VHLVASPAVLFPTQAEEGKLLQSQTKKKKKHRKSQKEREKKEWGKD
jgi:hypothetical protein